MAEYSIDLGALSKHNGDMEQLLKYGLPEILRIAGNRAGATFDEVVRTELPPPVRTQRAAPYWTGKQRRWWWGTMHKKAQGKSQALPGWKAAYQVVDGRKTLVLSGGHVRTGKLVQSLAYEVRQAGDTTDVVYGTNRVYAKYVIDREDQATYHKGNWKTLQDMAADATPRVVAAFDAAIDAEIGRRIG